MKIVNPQIGDQDWIIEQAYLKNLELQTDYRKKLKEVTNDFVQDVIDEDRGWVKGRRLEYLNSKAKEYKELLSPLSGLVDKLKGTTLQWLAESIQENQAVPIMKKLKTVELEIEGWINPVRNGEQLSREDIDRAREEDATQYLDIKSWDSDKAWASCIFHEEKNPSFCVYKDSNRYHCFSCNKNGDTIDLVMELYNKNFKDAVNFILKR